MIDINKLGDKVKGLVSTLPEDVGRARLVATYVSLRKAYDLGYRKDVFRQMRQRERDIYLQELVAQSPFEYEDAEGKTPKGSWLAGYYFNNALLRIAALAEISLKCLFEQHTGFESPRNYRWLADWYEKEFSTKITNLDRTRQEINVFKHEHPRRRQRKLETIEEGLAAFSELLEVMNHVASNYRLQLTARHR